MCVQSQKGILWEVVESLLLLVDTHRLLKRVATIWARSPRMILPGRKRSLRTQAILSLRGFPLGKNRLDARRQRFSRAKHCRCRGGFGGFGGFGGLAGWLLAVSCRRGGVALLFQQTRRGDGVRGLSKGRTRVVLVVVVVVVPLRTRRAPRIYVSHFFLVLVCRSEEGCLSLSSLLRVVGGKRAHQENVSLQETSGQEETLVYLPVLSLFSPLSLLHLSSLSLSLFSIFSVFSKYICTFSIH